MSKIMKTNTQVDEIVNIHKKSDKLYEECKNDYREMKRDVLGE